MRFFRNPEIQRLCVCLAGLTAAVAAVGFLFHKLAGLFALAAAAILCTAFLLYTAWRYRQIDRLSGYLKRITNGDFALDVRDNGEGELSILKSEIYKVTVVLSEYNDSLKREKGQLADSMADISHQLKTPMTSMMVMADLLQEDDLPAAKRREFVAHIRAQLERIQWLVSSLLKLSKLDAGTVVMRREPVLVRELVHRAVAPLLIPMELKEQTLDLQGPPDVRFLGDESWTTEALLNVVKNCTEHTPAGGLIRIAWQENPLFTEITVADSGQGIAKQDLPHIFTRFYRGSNAGEDSVGIGLAMAQSILRSQSGGITAENRPGGGALFRLRLYKGAV